MALKGTTKGIQDLLSNITTDLQKAENGNKAAAQRVRTGTIKLEKLAKVYRKESISDEKKNKGKKVSKSASHEKKGGHSETKTKTATKSHAHHKAAAPAAKPKKKATATKAAVKPSHLAGKKPTAKLPAKKSKLKSWLF